MVPDELADGAASDPAPQPSERSHGDPAGPDAFAATIAPQSPSPLGTTTRPQPATVAGKRSLSAVEADATMAAPLSQVASAATTAPGPSLPTVAAEHYKPDKEIARGGMGRIVAAEDQRLRRQVALKELLEPAGDALGRFEREALITARLQHPGIVPVYEAGRWPTGEPFFAMKLVSGEPLDRVIGKAHTLEARLALLPRVTAAVDAIAYAHSHRIVHRDLKPSNILIGEFGETVVIDWGLAKDLDAGDPEGTRSAVRSPQRAKAEPREPATTASSTLTVVGAVMGTPAYMAPEQARGEPVDQRADVFALGAMLYHLLAGVPPYNARTATDVIAAAALHKVVPLHDREAGAPADLVAIVERAMAAEPVARYHDAKELADELRRFLTGQLVSAHRYTARQRVARFIRKHRAAVTIAGIAIAAFAVLGTLAVRQIVSERDTARYERTLADARRVAAERLIDKMLSDVKARLVEIGRLDLLADLGNQIQLYYATLATTPGGMPKADVYRMAIAVELVGRAERDSGDAKRALETWRTARDQIAAQLVGDHGPQSRGARAMVARLDFQIGTIYQGQGKLTDAVAQYTKAKDGFAAILSESSTGSLEDRQILLYAGENHDRLGDLARNDGKLDLAVDEYTAAKVNRKTAAAAAGEHPYDELLAVATSHSKLGSVNQARGNTSAAYADFRAALRLHETLLEQRPNHVENLERVLAVNDTIADLQRQTGDVTGAVQTYERALPILESMRKRDPANAQWQRQHGNLLADLGFALNDSGAYARGLEALERAIALGRDLVARDPDNKSWRVDLSRSLTRAGDSHVHLGRATDAATKFEEGLALRDELVKQFPNSVPYRRSLAWSYAKLANVFLIRGDGERARAHHERALALRTRLVAESPAQSGFRNELALSEFAVGKLAIDRDRERARALVSRGLERAHKLVADDPINNDWKDTLTNGLLARSELAAADGDRAGRDSALAEALTICTAAATAAQTSAYWPALLADVHAHLAAAAPDAATASVEWKQVRGLLEPLTTDGRLSATRSDLLVRARTGR